VRPPSARAHGTEPLEIDALDEESVAWGEVTRITHFGAFVDIGCGQTDAFLHISDFPGRLVRAVFCCCFFVGANFPARTRFKRVSYFVLDGRMGPGRVFLRAAAAVLREGGGSRAKPREAHWVPPAVPSEPTLLNRTCFSLLLCSAPRTSEPRDMSRCGALSLIQKPLQHRGIQQISLLGWTWNSGI
jgi:hypothetical protein